jgi:hypothetical protein
VHTTGLTAAKNGKNSSLGPTIQPQKEVLNEYLNNASINTAGDKALKKRGQSIGTSNFLYDERNESPMKMDDSPQPKLQRFPGPPGLDNIKEVSLNKNSI